MHKLPRPIRAVLLATFALALSACNDAGTVALDPSQEEFNPSDSYGEPIIGGKKATAYPEAALINMPGSACSGALIAPRVVLTAGHCVTDWNQWEIILPFAGNQKATSTKAHTFYQSWGNAVNPSTPDVAVLVLSKPLQLDSYPKLQKTAVSDGTKAVNVGRINNGQFSSTALYVSQPLALHKSASFPFDYESVEVIQPGDSGGPVLLSSAGPHVIVAVNSGAGGTQILGRVDGGVQYKGTNIHDWIQGIIAQNGGSGDQGGGAGGSGGSGQNGGSGQEPPAAGAGGGEGEGEAGGSAPVDPPPSCAGGIPESEPNGNGQAQPLQGDVCGALSGGDEDWFTWSVAGAGVRYAVEVEGDAQLKLWKKVGGQYYEVPNQQPFFVANKSNGPGDYYLAVWNDLGASVPYTLRFKTW